MINKQKRKGKKYANIELHVKCTKYSFYNLFFFWNAFLLSKTVNQTRCLENTIEAAYFIFCRYSTVEYLFVSICHISFFPVRPDVGVKSIRTYRSWLSCNEQVKRKAKIIRYCYECLVAFKFSFCPRVFYRFVRKRTFLVLRSFYRFYRLLREPTR